MKGVTNIGHELWDQEDLSSIKPVEVDANQAFCSMGLSKCIDMGVVPMIVKGGVKVSSLRD